MNNIRKIDLFLGALIGFTTTIIGMFLYLKLFTDLNFIEGVLSMKNRGLMGKIITLGAIPNIITFFALLKIEKEVMARGVVLATILITIITFLV